MSLKDTFGKNLKYYRYKAGLSQEKLAEIVNIDSKYLSDLENGKYSPSFSKIERLATALDIDPYQLFKEDVTHHSVPPRVYQSKRTTNYRLKD